MVQTDDFLASYPPELISRVTEQAAVDGERVVEVLKVAGLLPMEGKTRTLPGDFLLELGAATRIRAWEADGLDMRDFQLPNAKQAIRQAFEGVLRRLDDPSIPTSSLSREVFRISVERLAWVGPRDLRAEVVLGLPDEDELVEAMARFLWENRPSTKSSDESMMS